MITRFTIEHYKSIERLDLELGPLTVLVGPNGIGKSNVVDAFRFLRDALRFGIDRAVSDRHGIDSVRQWSHKGAYVVSLGVDIEEELQAGNYSVAIGSSKKNYVIRREETKYSKNITSFKLRNKVKIDFLRSHDGEYVIRDPEGSHESIGATVKYRDELAITQHEFAFFAGMVESISNFEAYSIFPNTLRAAQLPSNDRRLSASGDNLTSVFKQMTRAQQTDEVLAAMRKIMPGLESIVVQSAGGFMTPVFRVSEGGVRHDFNVSQISDGTLRVFGLLTALYQPRLPAVIALEEPEQTVHPGVMALLAEAIREASTRSQVIVTTHSPELVEHFKPDEIRAVEMENGVTTVRPISPAQKEAVLRNLFTLGELMRIEGLHGA